MKTKNCSWRRSIQKLLAGLGGIISIIVAGSANAVVIIDNPTYASNVGTFGEGTTIVRSSFDGGCSDIVCEPDSSSTAWNKMRFDATLDVGYELTSVEVSVSDYVGPSGLNARFDTLAPELPDDIFIRIGETSSQVFSGAFSGPATLGTFRSFLSWIDNAQAGDRYSYIASWTFEVDRTQIPEPTTLALMSLGLTGIGFHRRKRIKTT
jgi:hypothetical protein